MRSLLYTILLFIAFATARRTEPIYAVFASRVRKYMPTTGNVEQVYYFFQLFGLSEYVCVYIYKRRLIKYARIVLSYLIKVRLVI